MLEERNTQGAQARIPDGATFFQNRACEHFPCHEGIDPDVFNCLFCYCPLYALGDACGGDFRYTASGAKDCTGCTLLHDGTVGAELVRARFADLKQLAARREHAESGLRADSGIESLGENGTCAGEGGSEVRSWT